MDSVLMKTMADLFRSSARDKLIALLQKFLRNHFDRDDLNQLLQKELTDLEYFEIFAFKMKDEQTSSDQLLKINFNRGKKRLADLNNLIQIDSSIYQGGSYLDVGSSDGIITSVVGQGLGFKISDICATDIVMPRDKNALDPSIVFKLTNGHTLDFPDDTFSLITLFQVMHHMVHLDEMLKELVRICKPGAIVVIREHDLSDRYKRTNNILYMLEHAFYEVLLNKENDIKTNYANFNRDYYAKYDTKDNWTRKLSEYGFAFINLKFITKYNPTNYYYAAYKYTGKKQSKTD
jgi:ubiquinone/menaquinone biosynthesis C-methylase UbiE